MKITKNKFLVKLIAVICLFLTLFNFIGTTKVYAESEGWGGVLIKPVVDLLTAIADGIMGFLNKNIEGQATALIKVEGDSNWWDKWGTKVLGIITGVIIAASAVSVIVGTGGAAALGVGTTIKIAVSLIIGTSTAGFLIADVMDGSNFPEDIYLPVFRVSLDRIFSDDIALLDINFFKQNKTYKREEEQKKEEIVYEGNASGLEFMGETGINIFMQEEDTSQVLPVNLIFKKEVENYKYTNFINLINKANSNIIIDQDKKISESSNLYFKIGTNVENSIKITTTTYTINIYDEKNQYLYSIIYINKYDSGTGLDTINAIKNTLKVSATIKDNVTVESTAQKLRGVISTWYFILRNVAMLVLMLVLIYIGIRIVIGSTAGEKAKYKERLMDWLVALCLIFVMHYIMAFAVEIVEKITDLVGELVGAHQREAIIMLTDKQYENITNNKPEIASQVDLENGNKDLYWNTDLMGQIKIYSQQQNEGTENWVGMAVAYVVLVFYTLFFIWTYLKRVLYMAFLTMIAPLVAMTYPIDKINDGKAQAFNMWFREYIFNLLIQPMHLLLYNVLVVSAYDLAAKSAMYTLVAIGFMVPAEKLVRKFFGFEKAQTPGLLGGAAGAALAMTGIQKLLGHHSKGKAPEKYSSKEDNNNIKQISSKESVDIFGTYANSRKASNNEETINLHSKPDTRNETGLQAQNHVIEELGISALKIGLDLEAGTEVGAENKAVTETSTKVEKMKKGLSRVGRTISGISKSYARQMGNKALKRIQNGRPIRTMLKGTTGLAGGALLGLTGAALGIASGDPNKVLQYTSAGALAGYGAGSGVSNSLTDTFSVNTKELEEVAKRSWYGEEYLSKKLEEEIKEELKSEKNIDRIMTLTGWDRRDTEEFLDTTGRACWKSEVTDVDDMLAIKRILEEENPEKRISTMEEAIAATKLKNKLSQKISSMTSKKLEEYEKTYVEAFKPKLRNLHTDWNETQVEVKAQNAAKILIKDMRNLDSVKSQLTKV